MYVTVRTYTGGTAFADALAGNEEAVRGIITTIAGFRAYYLARTADGVMTISVFDDQAGADESVRAAAAWVAENLGDVSPGPPTVTTGEVAFSL